MDHIRQYDWCSTEPDIYFVAENDIDNCVTEKILRNQFHDPLIDSESEDEGKPKETLNWDEIFSKKKNDKRFQNVVQGIHAVPPFPKLSALTGQQHYQCLKVLCSQCPDVLPHEFIPRPTKQDHRIFEEVKAVYEKEQQEFINWAKSLWTSSHCARALRPKPPIEMVYEAEFKVRANSLQSFPKNYALAAQIPLQTPNSKCDMVHQEHIIKVNVSSLPQIEYPDMTKRITIMKPCPIPEPCNKHLCRFILPSESTMTILPLTEIHRELAQFAFDKGATTIASESALRCLMQDARQWMLPVSVCSAVNAEGDSSNVVVLGSEFSIHKESAQMRTYKAFRRLLQYTLVSPTEADLPNNKHYAMTKKANETDSGNKKQEIDESDEEDHLIIDTDMVDNNQMETTDEDTPLEEYKSPRRSDRIAKEAHNSSNESTNKIGFYNCTCKDTAFESATPRSYRRWRVRDLARGRHDLVVHCPHRARIHSEEVILEPIPEYQIDLGGSEQPPDIVRSLALAMMLRKNASILNVRIDCGTGDIVRVEGAGMNNNEQVRSDVCGRLYSALDQLQGLVPGHYLLMHQPGHGSNALLYRAGGAGAGAGALQLQFCSQQLAEADEAAAVRAPPTLAPVLLPAHKFRKILPCAFTPHERQVAKESRRPVTRQKTPPQAIKLNEGQSGARRKWPKRKRRKNKNTN
ncbi:unnamed protein product [Diatraea saccharalis]|uniref:Little elongation complex subunit 2 C-terminal domain-containing protein n=1 Tax=Diatraea saccharalis TaxID=40085 RepID=A0A9P0C6S6_9NEOP|nr:unnamed protein product [Diatraea saccharalis]